MKLTTRQQANEYAQRIANIRKEEVFIFETPEGTQAREYGILFGTCVASEKDDYANDGATFIGSTRPR